MSNIDHILNSKRRYSVTVMRMCPALGQKGLIVDRAEFQVWDARFRAGVEPSSAFVMRDVLVAHFQNFHHSHVLAGE